MINKYLIYSLTCIFVLSIFACSVQEKQNSAEEIWKDGYFVQNRVKTPAPADSTIEAKVNNQWQSYKLRNVPKKFVEWNFASRVEMIESMKKMLKSRDKDMKGPELAGPHNGMVASYGYKREDSRFKLNNAVKGMGFLPKRSKIKEINKFLQETNDNSMMAKMDTLISLYKKGKEIFAMDKQISLELYASPKFNTQTFLNQYFNPISTIVFLDIPSYKLKTVVQLLHPQNPNLTEYEKDVVNYINLIHSYFHGKFPRDYIASIYYIIEVYDNSPGDPKAIGHRIVP